MDVTAPHMGFVYASYGLTLLLVAGLIAYVLHRDRSLRAEAERLDRSRRKAGT